MLGSFLSVPSAAAARALVPFAVDAPWTWVGRAFRGLYRWWQADETRSFMAATSLHLIVGGLAILFLVVALFLVQSVFPNGPQPLAAAKGSRELRRNGHRPKILNPVPAKDPVQLARRRLLDVEVAPTPAVDYILDGIVESNLGEPRILRDLPGQLRLRLFDCRGCTPSNDPDARPCHYEQSKIEAAFAAHYGMNVRVREIACRGRGDPECDFEVKH